jgi:ATP-dependent Clp protease ATP-binding subunit ClpB
VLPQQRGAAPRGNRCARTDPQPYFAGAAGAGARARLAEKGYDAAYGARPLKGVIQKHVQDPLAEAILAGEIHDGETVPVRLGPLGLIIGNTPTPRAPKEAPPAGTKLH